MISPVHNLSTFETLIWNVSGLKLTSNLCSFVILLGDDLQGDMKLMMKIKAGDKKQNRLERSTNGN